MIRRDGQSSFVDNLIVSKRGNVFLKTAAKQEGVQNHEDVKKLLDKFDKSPDIPDEYIQQHHERIEKGHDPKEITKDFFKGLQKAKESRKKLTIKTAKIFRQAGLFKKTEKDVYQDTETGDFWKISEDGKHVVRMFKEVNGVTE
jgi:hypothetical protein